MVWYLVKYEDNFTFTFTLYSMAVEDEKCTHHFSQATWEDNEMDITETGFEGVDWMHLAHDRDQWRALVNTVMNLRIP
jgi:hypothetical protein